MKEKLITEYQPMIFFTHLSLNLEENYVANCNRLYLKFVFSVGLIRVDF